MFDKKTSPERAAVKLHEKQTYNYRSIGSIGSIGLYDTKEKKFYTYRPSFVMCLEPNLKNKNYGLKHHCDV